MLLIYLLIKSILISKINKKFGNRFVKTSCITKPNFDLIDLKFSELISLMFWRLNNRKRNIIKEI